ncbi:universal stress protein [Actinoplanes sp. NBRC 14428]|nr:universal stress protein [Actinoplanes sp. NBRC 14428]
MVVGVDGSPASKAALRWALRHAGRIGADVEAVAVWTPPAAYYYGAEWAAAAYPGDELGAATETMLLDTLVEVTRDYGASVPIRPRVLRGRPAQELLRAAEGAQVLVLGGSRPGFLARLILGSVAHQCVHRASCPVLLVPAATAARRPAATRPAATVRADHLRRTTS